MSGASIPASVAAQGYNLVCASGGAGNFGYSDGSFGSLDPHTWVGLNSSATVGGIRSTSTQDLILEINSAITSTEVWRFIAFRDGTTITTFARTAFTLNIIGGTTLQYHVGTGASPFFNAGNVLHTFAAWIGE